MKLHVERLGPLGAPRVLLLHGGGTRAWSWREQRPTLAGHHALIPDLPGHSLSPRPLQFADAAQRLADLLEQEGVTSRSMLVANSVEAHHGA